MGGGGPGKGGVDTLCCGTILALGIFLKTLAIDKQATMLTSVLLNKRYHIPQILDPLFPQSLHDPFLFLSHAFIALSLIFWHMLVKYKRDILEDGEPIDQGQVPCDVRGGNDQHSDTLYIGGTQGPCQVPAKFSGSSTLNNFLGRRA